ncbi:MAG: ATP-dependent dethiobiotin synthetase BioD, partial [Acidimicrobiales bacterium]
GGPAHVSVRARVAPLLVRPALVVRPALLVVVTGTGTGVGKTWVSCAVLRQWLEAGFPVAARKPAQSFDVADGPTDADLLASASGGRAEEVCPRPRWYPLPMAPPMAAAASGRPEFTVDDLVAEMSPLPASALTLVEGAGGVASPLATDGDTATLADALEPHAVLLVAEAGLGTLNLIRLSVRHLSAHPVMVHLNRFDRDDPLHQANLQWLSRREEVDATTSVAALATRLASLAPPVVR